MPRSRAIKEKVEFNKEAAGALLARSVNAPPGPLDVPGAEAATDDVVMMEELAPALNTRAVCFVHSVGTL